VDREFGTGAVKLTPAHDQNDYDAAERHDLPKIAVIDHTGRISHEAAGDYHGKTVEEARKQIVADLKDQGLLVKTEDLPHNVGHCYKCDAVIEPLLREQWFVDMQPLAKKAIEALEANKITFYPENKKSQLVAYLRSLRDWNISRQIAWGIPIPAFQNVDDPDDWIYDTRVTEELITVDGKTYHRDPDVFDTWFSSSSWPYATLDYPDGEDYKEFYPLGLLETGGEILYPWVSRMIMLGLYVTGEVPFKEVYIHGYVMAEDGSKMSKSIGNVVDPIPVIDEFGSDALRMGIISGRAPAVNRGYDPRKVADARNFCNKLWNIARYIEDRMGEGKAVDEKPKSGAKPETVADHWVLSKLQQSADLIASHLDEYRFAEAYDVLYHFVWDDFADWYIEASKSAPNVELLSHCLESILKLAHPFAPFVTETIWQTLDLTDKGKERGDSILAKQTWPVIAKFDVKASREFDELQTIISECRFITKALGVQGATLYHTDVSVLADNAVLVARLARLADVVSVKDGTGVYLTNTQYRCWLDIDQTAAASYITQLGAKKVAQTQLLAKLEGRLANKAYLHDAPKRVVDQTRTQLQEAKLLLENIERERQRFQITD
jgi:valyl-tRNA synthetase